MPNEFVARNGIIALNNTIVTGSVTATTGFTGSLFGTASWALNSLTSSFLSGSVTSASYAFTASSATNAFQSVSSSFAFTASSATNAFQAVSASYAFTASSATNAFQATSASFAFTASSAVNSTNALTASSADNFVVRQSITASSALINGTITAQTLVVSTVSSSVVYSSGSNVFGNSTANTQTFTGSVNVTGSMTVTGRVTIPDHTGSLFGTASWAQNFLTSSVTSASYAFTASSAISASFATSASWAPPTFPFTGSAQVTGSMNITGSLSVGSSFFDYNQNTNVVTGSWQVVASEATASFRAAFFDYVMFSGSISRAGSVYTVWSGSATEFFETYTNDIGGSTSVVTLQTAISGSNIQLQATASAFTWTIRSLVRML